MDPTPATFTLVYACENDHEQTENCDTFEECGNYAVDDAGMCPECEAQGSISYPHLDRIEVDM